MTVGWMRNANQVVDSEAVGFFYLKSELLIPIIVVTVKYTFINLFAMQTPQYVHKLVNVPTLLCSGM